MFALFSTLSGYAAVVVFVLMAVHMVWSLLRSNLSGLFGGDSMVSEHTQRMAWVLFAFTFAAFAFHSLG